MTKKFLLIAGLVPSFVIATSSPVWAKHHRNDANEIDAATQEDSSTTSTLDAVISGLVSKFSSSHSMSDTSEPTHSSETTGPEDTLPTIEPEAKPSGGVRGVAAPVLHKEDAMEGRSIAVVRVLDRITSQSTLLEVPIGQSVHYGRLTVEAVKCLQRPIDLPYDSVQYLKLKEDGIPKAVNAINQKVDTTKEPEKLDIINSHEGWFLAKQPGVTAYESALYDVHAVRCAGSPVAPFLDPLPAPQVPNIGASGAQAGIGNHHVDATQLLPKNLRDDDQEEESSDQQQYQNEGLLPPMPSDH